MEYKDISTSVIIFPPLCMSISSLSSLPVASTTQKEGEAYMLIQIFLRVGEFHFGLCNDKYKIFAEEIIRAFLKLRE